MINFDPTDILFTTPTLNDELPVFSETPAGNECLIMHEDDWRQFEFVDAKHRVEVLNELSAIDDIWKNHSVPMKDPQFEGLNSFRKVHIRSLLKTPLQIPFTTQLKWTLFGLPTVPVTFWNSGRQLADVQAVSFRNSTIYVQFTTTSIRALGLEISSEWAVPAAAAAQIEEFIRSNQLLLVHWRSRTLFSNPEEIMHYIRGAPNRSGI